MSSLAQQLVLKEGDIFLLSHESGDISGNSGLGMYYQDLRYLGLDGVPRSTILTFDRIPDTVDIRMPENKGPIYEPTKRLPVVGLPSFHILIEPPVATMVWNVVVEPNLPVAFAFHVLPEGV